MGNKNRTLCSFLKRVVDSKAKENLLAMVENLLDLFKIPGGLEALTITLHMQLFFLKQLITQSKTQIGHLRMNQWSQSLPLQINGINDYL